MAEEPKIRIRDREELIYMLAEAAAIEHNVMCCYLYGIWSLKRGERDGLTPEQAKVVQSWKAHMTQVAVEEMTHLTLVGNLACAIGGAPHLSRPNFPIPFGYHAAAIDLELFQFSHALVDHAIFLERPEGVELEDAPEFAHPSDYHREVQRGAIMANAQDYATIGHLYRGIFHGFEVLSRKLGEDVLFCGDVEDQISPKDAPLPGLCVVTDLASAREAIETIVEQGEGAPAHSEDSHYQAFLGVKQQLEEMQKADPSFEPAFPVARNPVPTKPADPENRVWINDPEAAKVLDLGNSIYNLMLRFLSQSFGRDPGEASHKRLFTTLARELMSVLTPVGEHLASLPASPDHPGVNAGISFTMIRDIERLPAGPGEMIFLSERLEEIARHAEYVFPPGHELEGIGGALRGMSRKITPPERAATAPEAPPPPPAPPHPTDSAEEDIGVADGKDMVLHFDTKRCIHARFCVLGAPEVFLANVEGPWLFPDKMPISELRGVCHNCPSGAITYEPKGDIPAEPAPNVNLVNLRENGPYAFRAPLEIDGEKKGFRATLCRCGASKNKPFCDNSHREIGFEATGEPETRPSDALEVRNGPLEITPQKNGPLEISGNLEICSGTGRTVDRVQTVRFCRCGGSKTKPFCDNTHLKIGFKSE
ncbi:MAG: CDGSH iron-sulfur domain-containing protein [Rhodobacteraceae bacterium]|nr:CDGSH iron-sulfur domain-containing protein [Paracoccaceae bacterium]